MTLFYSCAHITPKKAAAVMSSKLRYKVMSEAGKQHYCDSVSELIRLNVTELMI